MGRRKLFFLRAAFLTVQSTFLLILLFSSHLIRAEEVEKICKNFYIESTSTGLFSSLNFGKNEKILICGADEPGWSDVPVNQAKASISTFLQSRGYYQSVFKQEAQRIIILPGPISEIKKINFKNSPPDFKDEKFLGLKNSILNTENLDALEAWSLSRLRTLGYPCPELKITAQATTGYVEVSLFPKKKMKIGEIDRETPSELNSKALDRFHAFRVGDIYNGTLFDLTSRRMQSSGLLDYSNFDNQCELNVKIQESSSKTGLSQPAGVFKQRLGVGNTKSLIVAFGATTEQFPILKATWRNALLNSKASSFETNLFLSSVRQSLDAKSYLYFFNSAPRLYFFPEFSVARLSERVFESFDQKYSVGMGYSYDDAFRTYSFETKPTYNFQDLIEGVGSKSIKFFSLENQIKIFSHDFEYFRQSPRSGYELNFDWSARRDGFGSSVSSDRLKLTGTYLLNWGGFDPPLVVLGFRFKLSTLVTTDLNETPNRLRIYLGGDRDLRGFSRNSVNNNDLGFQTASYTGTELRFVKILPYGLQPLVFADVAVLGESAFQWSTKALTSFGLGMRWQSPLGAIRGTLGRGFANSEDRLKYDLENTYTLFLSLGQEF